MDIQPVGSASIAGQKALNGLPDAALPVKPAAAQAAEIVAAPAKQPPASAPSALQLAEAVKNINKTLQSLSPGLQFSVDTDSNRTIVKVVDQQTQEVIRQMPSAEALEMAKALDKVQGLLIRQKA